MESFSFWILQVHLYSDHIAFRDGIDLKCPKRYCDKVYPNKESLRLHIIAHYQHNADAAPGVDFFIAVDATLLEMCACYLSFVI